MHCIKRNIKFSILSFLSPAIILTLTNYIQFLTKTDIYFSFMKIQKFELLNAKETLKIHFTIGRVQVKSVGIVRQII